MVEAVPEELSQAPILTSANQVNTSAEEHDLNAQ
jgi:hypothetical protein